MTISVFVGLAIMFLIVYGIYKAFDSISDKPEPPSANGESYSRCYNCYGKGWTRDTGPGQYPKIKCRRCKGTGYRSK